jgi:hypothetical protein
MRAGFRRMGHDLRQLRHIDAYAVALIAAREHLTRASRMLAYGHGMTRPETEEESIWTSENF